MMGTKKSTRMLARDCVKRKIALTMDRRPAGDLAASCMRTQKLTRRHDIANLHSCHDLSVSTDVKDTRPYCNGLADSQHDRRREDQPSALPVS